MEASESKLDGKKTLRLKNKKGKQDQSTGRFQILVNYIILIEIICYLGFTFYTITTKTYQFLKLFHLFLFFTISARFFTKLFYCPMLSTLCSMSLSFYCDYKSFCNFYYNFRSFPMWARISQFNSDICCFKSFIYASFSAIF